MTGISNGGYLTRWQLENRPALYDGGVDWEGTLMRADGPNLFTYLPAALQAPRGLEARATRPPTGRSSPPASRPAPSSSGTTTTPSTGTSRSASTARSSTPATTARSRPATRSASPGTPACDADYDYASRPQAVKDAVGRVSLTGRIGKPMLTLHGTLDALLPIRTDSDVYARMIRDQGRGGLHRYYVIEGGSHVDSRYDRYPAELRPILPCYRAAFEAFEAMIERGAAPPPSQTVGAHRRRRRRQRLPAAGRRRGRRHARPRREAAPARARHAAARPRRAAARASASASPPAAAPCAARGCASPAPRAAPAAAAAWSIVRRIGRAGVRRAVVRKRGFRAATVRIRVLRRR